ncbi:MAG: MmgE/PrpD family protein [Chloroflexi bacterium]|nr:MmgE/PrpD family protein [Chloroflexota bacterium]
MPFSMSQEEALQKPTRALARFVVETKYEDLPPEVVHEAKRLILDIIGNTLGGGGTELGVIALKYLRMLGGAPECTILSTGEKTSVLNAAYANSRIGDALDATDMILNSAHVGTPVVSSALAFGERSGATGKDLITAVALGFEVGARLAICVATPLMVSGQDVHRNRMPLFEFGSCSAAAKIMGLDEDRMVYAYGFTGANASLMATRWTEAAVLPLTKYGDAGLQASEGGMGALMAQCGITTYDGILDGDHGLWKFRDTGACDFNIMVGDLGKKWYLPENSYKPWTSLRWTHHGLTILTKLVSENDIKAEDIERILVKTAPRGASGRFANKNPIGMVSCEFNQPHAMAMGALGIKRGPLWYAPETMNDPRVRALRDKVDVAVEPRAVECKSWPLEDQIRKRPTSVAITAKGKTFEGYTEYAKGDPWSPETYFTDEDIQAKFRDLASAAHIASTSWRDRMEEIIATVMRLDQVEAADLMRLF